VQLWRSNDNSRYRQLRRRHICNIIIIYWPHLEFYTAVIIGTSEVGESGTERGNFNIYVLQWSYWLKNLQTYSVFTLRGTTKYFSSMTLICWNGVYTEWQMVFKYTFSDKFQNFNSFDTLMRDTTYFFVNGNINFFLRVRIKYFFLITKLAYEI